MITPRLFRRSLAKALQWRLLLLWWASLAVPGAIAALPVFQFLGKQLDHSPRAKDAVAYLDGPTLLDLLRQLGEDGTSNAIALGLVGGALTLLFVSPFVAGAATAAARSDEPLPLSRLLAGAGELYGRMLRTFICGLLPLAIGGAIAAGAMKLASRLVERDITETAADAHQRYGMIAAGIAIFLAHLLVDAARAQFAAEPTRRSALAALWSSVRLLVRRPLRAAGVGAVGLAVGVGTAALLMILRLRIDQGGMAGIGAAWVLAQMALLAVGWGRAARIFGLAELSRADAADRARPFRLEPPTTSPPPVLQAETSPAAAPLSPPGASGT